MIALLVPLMAFLRVPEPLRRLASGIALGAALIALIVAMWFWIDDAEKDDDAANVTKGRQEERAEQQAITLDRIEQGGKAREEIRDPSPAGDDARYRVCLSSARNPEACERFLRVQPTDHPLGAPVQSKR